MSVGEVSIAGRDMYTNEAIASFAPGLAVDVRYGYYMLPLFVRRNCSYNIYGAAILNQQLIRSAPLAVPPMQEQIVIADYLDRETARIDELIAEQEGLSRDLDARRSALIDHHTEWHSQQPISHNFSVVLGKMLDGARKAHTDDVLLPYLRAANVQDHGLVVDSLNEMPFTLAERLNLNLRSGDLLVVEGGAVGTCFVLGQDLPDWSFQKTLNRVRARSAHSSTQFLAYVLRSMRDSGHLDIVCNKSTIPHLTAEKLLALRVPQPPRQHQDEVVAALDHHTAGIDELLAECQALIALLKERRAALITAAVTGQIDVTA